MAFVDYEGLRKPSALDQLIQEGVLPRDPGIEEYSWEVYNDDSCGDEEILSTPTCVVWSQGGVARRYLRFDFDRQNVQQALLTWFDAQTPSADRPTTLRTIRKRALVVILERHACIHYLDGPNHLVHLPFLVEKAFALPRGLLLLRKLHRVNEIPSTPLVPTAPPNSFFSSQTAREAPVGNAASGDFKPEGWMSRSNTPEIDNAPLVWVLVDPLDEIGLVIQERSSEAATSSAMPVPHEQILLYVSNQDEFAQHESSNDPVMVATTFDTRKSMFSIWLARYTRQQESPKAASARHRRKSSKARRRSSHGLRASTGLNTPRLRFGDQQSDSLAHFNQGSLQASSQHSIGNPGALAESSQRSLDGRSKIEASFDLLDDEAITSNRRTSSLIARAELSHGDHRSFSEIGKSQSSQPGNFGAQHSRTSFGMTDPRKSQGSMRKSMRLSTTSMAQHLEDVDERMQLDFDEELTEALVQEFDLLTERMTWTCLKSFPSSVINQGQSYNADNLGDVLKIFTSSSSQTSPPQKLLSLFMVDRLSRHVSEFRIKFSTIVEANGNTADLSPKKEIEYRRLPYFDGLKLSDNGIAALLFLSRNKEGIQASIVSHTAQNSSAVENFDQQGSAKLNIPGSETFVESKHRLLQSRQLGRFDISDNQGIIHGFVARLLPVNVHLTKVLEVVAEIMDSNSNSVWNTHSTYWKAYTSTPMADCIERERCAVQATILYFASAILAAFRNDIPQAKHFFDSQHTSLPESHGAYSAVRYAPAWAGSDSLLSKKENARGAVKRFTSESIQISVQIAKRLAVEWATLSNVEIDQTQDAKVAEFLRATTQLRKLVAALHVLEENEKIHVTSISQRNEVVSQTVVIMSHWLGLEHWSLKSRQHLTNRSDSRISSNFGILESFMVVNDDGLKELQEYSSAVASLRPCSVFDAIQYQLRPTVEAIIPFTNEDVPASTRNMDALMTRSTTLLNNVLRAFQVFLLDTLDSDSAKQILRFFTGSGSERRMPSTITEGMRVLFGRRLEELAKSQELLTIHDRDTHIRSKAKSASSWLSRAAASEAQGDRSIENDSRDVHSLCVSEREIYGQPSASEEAQVMHRFLFRTDKRVLEAKRLLDPIRIAVAEIQPRPGSTEAMFLEDQKSLAQNVYKRTMAIPCGQAAIQFSSYQPMLTEKMFVPSFNTSCNMQPSNNTVMASQANFTEEKVCWAFFHAGVNAGLRISKHAQGINTSWLVLNKPQDLGNRHAGFLLALGLNGHLKSMAKWLAFKYLTPKHNMTSIGLLLGLAASNLGTMDNMVTRLLSVHVIRLLPPGTAELNLSPLTQTAGVAGIGLLYYNSEHRRMSEVLLSEIEIIDLSEPNTNVKDEGYRLAAGISLGFINLGKGRSHTTHGLHMAERLLAVATGTKETANVHILDQATAGATIALALIFMKTGDRALAKRIDVPASARQHDFIRPDILCLRTLAKNLIMWDDIQASNAWILQRLPEEYRASTLSHSLDKIFKGPDPFSSDKIPFYNIATGLCLSVGLRFAGTADTSARDLLCLLLASVMSISPNATHSFDQKLTRDSIIRLQYTLALCLSAVMAGTGDLETFRRLRMLYASVNEETSFGHHQAASMAIGILFLGGGRYTLSKSTFAIASLVCAFYPIFPKDVLDNRAHLQALRHLWVFAAEARAIIPRDAHTSIPVVTPINVRLLDGMSLDLTAPCLLPELDTISTVEILSNDYHSKSLDFTSEATTAAFRKNQSVSIQRKSLAERYPDSVDRTLALLSKSSAARDSIGPFNYDATIFEALLHLPTFKRLAIGRGELLDLLNPAWDKNDDDILYRGAESNTADNPPVSTLLDISIARLDSYLALASTAKSSIDRSRLEDLRAFLALYDSLIKEGKSVDGFSSDWVNRLKGILFERMRREREQAAESG